MVDKEEWLMQCIFADVLSGEQGEHVEVAV